MSAKQIMMCVKKKRRVSGRMFNSSHCCPGTTVKLWPCLRLSSVWMRLCQIESPLQERVGKSFVKLTWLALLSLFYILVRCDMVLMSPDQTIIIIIIHECRRKKEEE